MSNQIYSAEQRQIGQNKNGEPVAIITFATPLQTHWTPASGEQKSETHSTAPLTEAQMRNQLNQPNLHPTDKTVLLATLESPAFN